MRYQKVLKILSLLCTGIFSSDQSRRHNGDLAEPEVRGASGKVKRNKSIDSKETVIQMFLIATHIITVCWKS